MRIALIGTRGVPAAYGGFETAVEEVGARLAAAGHDVIVYCRGRQERPASYRGMRTIDLPAIRSRSAETLSHTLASVAHAVTRSRPEVAIVFNAANSPLLPLLRAAGIPAALHTDGLEWQRGKWGPAGTRYYLMAEAWAVHLADALISDADGIAEYYQRRYGAVSTVIRYGANVVRPRPARLDELQLTPGGYHLVVARLEPENHVDVILEGFRRSAARLPLIVVGSVPYPTAHTADIERRAAADPRVRLLGGIWDQNLLDTLYAHAACYLHGHSVGGTNPSLLRAMGAAAPVASFDVSFNREVASGDDASYWSDPAGVAEIVEDVEAHPERWRDAGELGRKRVETVYQWQDVADGYEALARRLASGELRRGRGSLAALYRRTRQAAVTPTAAGTPLDEHLTFDRTTRDPRASSSASRTTSIDHTRT